MEQSLQDVIRLLDLEATDRNHYRTACPNEGWQQVYGGQVIGQALAAASRTVAPGRNAHSLHGYFLRPGEMNAPILYVVDRIRDGKSFTTRQVAAVQNGEAIFTASMSFQVEDAAFAHQFEMPDAPDPETLEDEGTVRARQAKGRPAGQPEPNARQRPIEIRPINPVNIYQPSARAPRQMCWMRSRDRLPDDARLHQCVLAYLSDGSLLDTAVLPHGVSYFDDGMQVASLDHAMWFHRPFRADQWLLYVQDSPVSSGGRGLARGLIYSQSGELVASAAQEGLIRRR
ncbi:MAG: acyl-CoA thioesterase II [Gammaproteobacteria bacterium]|nr:acyl-CoA thioesterase II [Gammaproteobacteria bacterium]